MLVESLGRPTMIVNLWASLAYGLVLILAPDLFCDLLAGGSGKYCMAEDHRCCIARDKCSR